MVFQRQNHKTFIFIKTMAHDLLIVQNNGLSSSAKNILTWNNIMWLF